jgi:uncharacterized membrane protein YraQ (UPF0718 family)
MTAIALRLSAAARTIHTADRVWVAVLLIVTGLALLVPDQALASLRFTAESLVATAPFILLSVAVAAYAKAASVDRLLGRAFAGRVGWMIVAAAVFGALSPFCSCGVIPLIAALLAMGMPLPAVMAFWLASPIMDPETFIITAAGLGLDFALAKALAAVVIGLIGGFATLALLRGGLFAAPLKAAACGCPGAAVRDDGTTVWKFWREAGRRAVFAKESWVIGHFLLKWLSFAFVLESLMLVWLPAEAIGAWLGGDSALAIPLAVLAGIPAYLNSFAAVPTVSALIALGMTPGAGLAFMTAGAITSIPAAVAVYALVRPSVFLWYLVLAVTTSTLVGFAYQLWLVA